VGHRPNFREILVVDLEATCWRGTPPAGERNEIIEIGVAILCRNGDILPFREMLIKPRFSRVSPYCTELTTITQAQVDGGMSFESAIKLLIYKLGSKNKIWTSYGAYDRKMFQQSCQMYGLEYPFGEEHWNVKTLFAMKEKLNRGVGMAKALDTKGIALAGIHHRGIDDAYNTAKLLKYILNW
jgi:inhibitor of KinA sporulation pathway (predicted exonuclease)